LRGRGFFWPEKKGDGFQIRPLVKSVPYS